MTFGVNLDTTAVPMKSVALAIEEPTPRGIAASIARMITSGDLAPGEWRELTAREVEALRGISKA